MSEGLTPASSMIRENFDVACELKSASILNSILQLTVLDCFARIVSIKFDEFTLAKSLLIDSAASSLFIEMVLLISYLKTLEFSLTISIISLFLLIEFLPPLC